MLVVVPALGTGIVAAIAAGGRCLAEPNLFTWHGPAADVTAVLYGVSGTKIHCGLSFLTHLQYHMPQIP